MNHIEKYKDWCQNDIFDEQTKKELQEIQGNEKEIEDRFYKELEFGTAGLRGIVGAGTNRMNIYTVGKATQGLANYIQKEKGQQKGVAISYDSRHMSKEFSQYTAAVLNANGIRTYLFEELRPVPELSFAVRKLGCIAGIMITASHNPPKYNGYKVYWDDGAQIVAPKDKEIIAEVNQVESYESIQTMARKEAEEKELYYIVGKEIDDQYIDTLKSLVIHPEIIKEMAEDLKIVYTPLHGTGYVPVKRILEELGFKHVFIVPEQAEPDGDFPTVDYPNPEDPKAFDLALKLAKEVEADVILATDPDSDRLGVYAKDSKTGEYRSFTGNMSGLLIAEYRMSQQKEKGILPKNGVLIKTIVSSNLADAMVKAYGIELIEVLTGFKYIGEQMRLFDETKEKEYVFGYEESYGCLIGTHARDKDAVAAVMALCEAAAFYQKQGLTLWDQMINMYEKYGYYKEGLTTITLEGIEGAQKIEKILEEMKNHPIDKIGEYEVIALRDYSNSKRTIMQNKQEEEIKLPKSEVLYYELSEDAWCCVRPSGTEPKIKFYMGVKGASMEDANEQLEKLTQAMKKVAQV